MGAIGVAGVVLAVATALLWVRRHRTEAVFVALTALPIQFTALLREAIGRPRPTDDLVQVIGGPQGDSFPSGHAFHVLFFYGFLIYLALRLLPDPLARALAAAGAGYIVLSGLWLIYNGRHWPFDVLGGFIYGACVVLIWIAAYRRATYR